MKSVWVKVNWGLQRTYSRSTVQRSAKWYITHTPSRNLLTTSSSAYWPWGGVLSENRDKEQKANDKYQELGFRLKCTIGKRHAEKSYKTYNTSRHTWRKKATLSKERPKGKKNQDTPDRQEKQRNEQFSMAVCGVTVYHGIEATAKQRASKRGREKRKGGLTWRRGEINKEGQRAGGSSKWIRLRECVR